MKTSPYHRSVKPYFADGRQTLVAPAQIRYLQNAAIGDDRYSMTKPPTTKVRKRW